LFQNSGDWGVKANFSRLSSTIFIDNSKCIADVIFGGVCHRFPKLKMVSVESAAGWLLSALESMDWQWQNGGVAKEHPEYDLLPSQYFERQIYGSFWFERASARAALERFPRNLMWETDYPHPTSMHPTPGTPAQQPAEYADQNLGDLPEAILRSVFHETAARLYRVEGPNG